MLRAASRVLGPTCSHRAGSRLPSALHEWEGPAGILSGKSTPSQPLC